MGRFINWIKNRVVNSVKESATLNNPVYNFVTGELKQEGVNRLMNTLMVTCGDMLSTRNLPGEGTIVDKFSTNVYLSKSKAEELVKVLTVSYERLNGSGVEGDFLSEYRRLGLKQLRKLLKELGVYIRTFDILANGKKGIIFKTKITYKDVLDVKKRMYDSLKKLVNIASSKLYEGMTYDYVANKLIPAQHKEIKRLTNSVAKEAAAIKIVRESIDVLNDNCNKYRNGKEWGNFFDANDLKTMYDCLSELLASGVIKGEAYDTLKRALLYTQGLDITHTKGKCSHKSSTEDNYSDEVIKKSTGYKEAFKDIELEMEQAVKGFKFGKMVVPTVLLGDAMIVLKGCIEYTLKQLNKVLGTGDKDSVAASIDFDKLLGECASSNTSKSSKKTEDIKRTANVSVSQKDFEKMTSAVKKMYDKTHKIEESLKLSVEKIPTSVSKEDGGYTLTERFKQLGEYEKTARSKTKIEEQTNSYNFYYRKANKFLRMCKDYTVYLEDVENRRKNQIKSLMANAKYHYNELQQQLKDKFKNRSERKKLKDQSDILGKVYKDEVPSSFSEFFENYEVSVGNVGTFMKKIVNDQGNVVDGS